MWFCVCSRVCVSDPGGKLPVITQQSARSAAVCLSLPVYYHFKYCSINSEDSDCMGSGGLLVFLKCLIEVGVNLLLCHCNLSSAMSCVSIFKGSRGRF